MKNTIKYIILLITISCKSQVTTIVPLSSYDFPNGAYLKDLNNELNPYVGRWEGISNNKKYIFEFIKFTQRLNSYTGAPTGDYHYEDELVAKLKVIDLATNQVLYDNLSVTNYEDYLLLGLNKHKGMFKFMFREKSDKCYLNGEFYLMNINGQLNQLKYRDFTLKSYLDYNCTSYTDINQIPFFLPKEDLILTKI